MIIQYREHNGPYYLELHALRAPVGDYHPDYQENAAYDDAVAWAIKDFEFANQIELFCLGRSGRHICIADTPRNRRRYASLRRKAIAAARAMWDEMRKPIEPLVCEICGEPAGAGGALCPVHLREAGIE
jgi:hypothetical protein